MRDSTAAVDLEPVSRLSTRFFFATDRLTALLTRYQSLFLTLATIAYFAETCYRAHRRMFWYDEIFTFYISRLPDVRSMWTACLHGADFNPPLFYLLTHWSQNLFGATELGTRMPEIVGFWIFCLCLYRFVTTRISAVAGFIALLYPLTTRAYWYAYEARPHGLVIGLFGIALICWQSLANGSRRRLPLLAGLAASLACASLCHGYAFLLFIALGLGELFRTLLNRRIDFGIWCALILAAIVEIAVALPLLHSVHSNIDPAAMAGMHNSLAKAWDLAYTPGFAITLLLVFSAWAILPDSSRLSFTKDAMKPASLAPHEIAMLLAILSVPFFAIVAARLSHSPFFGRYSLILVLGVSAVIGIAFARFKTLGLLVLSLTALQSANEFVTFYRGGSVLEPSSDSEISTRPSLEKDKLQSVSFKVPADEPIVFSYNMTFAPAFYYATSSLLPRLWLLTPNWFVENYLQLQRCCAAPGNIASRTEFLATHRNFYVYGYAETAEWFRLRGASVAPQGCKQGCLWQIDFPAR
jgi:hypothetical protein